MPFPWISKQESGTIRVLVADDDMVMQSILKDGLELDGYVVDLAGDGSEALAMIKAQSYALVIMDRSMPRMDGIQAVSAIRSSPKFGKLKIIMCTSANVVKEIDEAFQAGADDYIIKPVDFRKLRDKMNKLLGKSESA